MLVKNKEVTVKKLFGITFFIFPILFIPFLIYFDMKFDSHPSSTSALIYVAIPAICLVSIIAGFIFRMIGLYIGQRIESRTKYKSVPKKNAVLYVLIGCAVAISTSAFTAYSLHYTRDRKIEPRVLVENIHIKKENLKNTNELKLENWNLIDNENVSNEEFSTISLNLANSRVTINMQPKYSFWNGQKVYLVYDESNAYILTEESENTFRIIAKHGNLDIDYISNIKGIEIDFNGEKYFALLTVLRATLQRSILTIYSPDKNIFYRELTGRIRTISTVAYNNKTYLVTGNERFPEYLYSWE